MKVAVYYNLHKHTFSLQSRNKEDYGRVIGHTEYVILKNVSYVVREAGHKKVLSEKKKNVHAFVVGEIVDEVGDDRGREQVVSYNPYNKASFFYKDSGEECSSSKYAVLRKGYNGKPIIGAY